MFPAIQYLWSGIHTFFKQVWHKMFGYTVAKYVLAQEIRLGSLDRFSSWEGGVWAQN